MNIIARIRSSEYTKVLKKKSFRNIWLAGMASSAGDGLHTMAALWLISNETSSAFTVSSIVVANSLPILIFGLIGGAAADRFNRSKQMVFADLARAFVVLLFPILNYLSWLTVPTILGITFLRATLDRFFYPAQTAVIPLTVNNTSLPIANSLNSSGRSIAYAIAVALAGPLVEIVGPVPVFYIDSTSFVVSALFLKNLNLPSPNLVLTPAQISLKSYCIDIRWGVSSVFRTPALRVLVMVNLVSIFAFAPYRPVALLFFRESAGMSATQYSFNLSLGSFSLMIGFMFAGHVIKTLTLNKAYTLGYLSMGVLTILIGFFPVVGFIYIASILRAISNQCPDEHHSKN